MIHAGLDHLQEVSKAIVALLPNGGIVILQGTLSSGKTTLTQAFAKFLGLNDSVTSPTFSLQQVYSQGLYHYDLYNYGLEKFLSMGMMEEFERPGYHLIEWGDEILIQMLKRAGFECAVVTITKMAEESREYEVKYG